MLSCYHIFHNKCIDSWLREYKNCPICKKELNDYNDLLFNKDDFRSNIEVDNENFYSEHLVFEKHKLISS